MNQYVKSNTQNKMEGLSSSNAAIRNKRDDWLSRGKSGIFVKVMAAISITIGLVLAIVFLIPVVKKYSIKQSALKSSSHRTNQENENYSNSETNICDQF